jgi:hypothetical protein
MQNHIGTFTFVILWTFATMIGNTFGLLVGTVIGLPVGNLSNAVGLMVVGALIGASIGFGQWLVLRAHGGWARGWTLVSTLGGLGGFLLGFMLAPAGWMGGVVHGLVLGGGLGIAQWVILRRVKPRAIWWVVVSSVSYGIAWGAGVGVLAADVYGISTGLLFEWFIHGMGSEAAHTSAPGSSR